MEKACFQVSASRGEEKVSAVFAEKTFGENLISGDIQMMFMEKGLFSKQPDLSCESHCSLAVSQMLVQDGKRRLA